MLATAEIRHHMRGRLRLRFAAGRRDRALLDELRRNLVKAPGVRRIQLNPAAAGIVIEYDPALYPEFAKTLATFAEQENLFCLGEGEQCEPVDRSLTDRAINDMFGRINDAVENVTGNVINLKELAPFAIGMAALLFVDRAAVASQWLSWIQFAWSSYCDLHQDEPVHEVGQEVRALRADLAAVRQMLEQRSEARE